MKSRELVVRMVLAERERQDKKWGYPQKNTPFEWISILTEEVGELAQALNDSLLGPKPCRRMDSVIRETIHVAAVALSIVEHIDQFVPDGVRMCKKCGCTDFCACDNGCYWVEEDLCSECVPINTANKTLTIKPLEWQDEENDTHVAFGHFGTFEVMEIDGRYEGSLNDANDYDGYESMDFDTVEEAKAHCQMLHEKQVMAALEFVAVQE